MAVAYWLINRSCSSEEIGDHELTHHAVCAELSHFVSVQVLEESIVHRVGKLADLNQAGRKDRSTVSIHYRTIFKDVLIQV